MDVLHRNSVTTSGGGDTAMVFAHGFGCDSHAWDAVTPHFEQSHRVVLFDHVGAGRSDVSAYDPARYASLDGYATDVVEIGETLGLEGAVFVGHSVSAMIGMLAALRAPHLFRAMVMVCPSPSYIDDGDYVGGFGRDDIEDLLEVLDSNFLGWSRAMTPTIMGNADRPELARALSDSFCRADPEIAKAFARVTFLSDLRADVSRLATPTLILQTQADVIAPVEVGKYMHASLPDSELVLMEASGHCPHMSAPDETVAAIQRYLSR